MIDQIKSAMGLLLVLFVSADCSGGIPAKDVYLSEHMSCVAKFSTRKDIDTCREAVRVKWGVSDGGN